jgi:DNA polymerase-3 subunit alpha
MGICILPPDVNASEFEFTIEEDSNLSPEDFYAGVTIGRPKPSAIRYGLGAIKGLSRVAMLLSDNRTKGGQFTGIDNFLSRFGKKEMNKKALDVLVLSGALDTLALDLKENPITIIDTSSKTILTQITFSFSDVTSDGISVDRLKLLDMIYVLRGYGSTEGILDIYTDESSTISMKKKYAKVDTSTNHMALLSVEHFLLGMYVTSHPLSKKAEPTDWQGYTHGMRFDITCIIRNVRTLTTRFGKPMAFVSIETLEGMKDTVVFTKEYETHQKKLDVGGIVTLTLESQFKDGSYSYIVKNIKLFKG